MLKIIISCLILITASSCGRNQPPKFDEKPVDYKELLNPGKLSDTTSLRNLIALEALPEENYIVQFILFENSDAYYTIQGLDSGTATWKQIGRVLSIEWRINIQGQFLTIKATAEKQSQGNYLIRYQDKSSTPRTVRAKLVRI